ncbi:IS6 family transposase [Commensalibacter nepenthis]|uniref:IS6 family transposase n=1 Tax=Commensalibacter nepenthis TaxID=3043872 RepID=A0ABT6Q4T5_9PROT|nr:IS6 family transposase [Commensalibacter sp. TBRC 10068]MDI2111911.1 IS6 family transposase [Commensalibacter sp. TBRC 10068]
MSIGIYSKLILRSRDDFKGRHFNGLMIIQAVNWYLRYCLSYRDIEELFLERGINIDHSTLNRWVLRYAPLLEKRLRSYRKPHCGEVRIDETYIKVKGQWKYLYRAIDKNGTAIDFLLTAKRNIKAAQRFFRKAFKKDGLFAPTHIGTDKALPFPKTIQTMKNEHILPNHCVHETKKSLQQGIENDHFRVKRIIPKNGCFQSFHTARKTLKGYEAILWIKKGLGFKEKWTINEQIKLIKNLFGLNKPLAC